MNAALRISFLAASIILLIGTANAQDHEKHDAMQKCPMHDQHTATSHDEMVQKNGDQAMGFPHGKTTHHFRILVDGGAIEVTANDPSDTANINAIRSHLSHIAPMFRDGDFSTPMQVHDSIPPGTTTMKLLKDQIGYTYEEIAAGGRVRIASKDEIAVAAIHDFLRFQITEHHTGDNLTTPDSASAP
jgi:hypothetical protein